MDYADLVAAFEAKGGKVTKVESGARAIESDRTIYAAMREGVKASADTTAESRETEARAERQSEAFRSAKYDGWANSDAHDYSQEAV